MHVGTNNLKSNSNPQETTKSITNIAKSSKTNTYKVLVPGIVPRQSKVSKSNKKSENQPSF